MHGHTAHRRRRDIELELRRHILTLWQTALIRLSRLKIQDEIETGLRYYPAAFFEVIPQVNAEVRAALQARWPDADLLERADPAARVVDRRRPRRQPERHRRRRPAGHRQRRLHRAGALLRRDHRARGGAVDVGAAGEGQRRTGRAGRRVRRARARRRTVPARAAGHPRRGSPRPRSRSSTANPSTSSTSDCDALRDPCGAAGRPRCRRRVAASQRQRGARRRSAGPAAGSRARLRFSPVRPGHAAELRCARGGRRRAAGLGGRAPRLSVAGRAGPRRGAGRRTRPPAGR